MSIFTQNGLMVAAYEPLSVGIRPLGDITDEIAGYSHTLLADGGYWSAGVGLSGTKNEVEEWIENGLARRIVIYDHTMFPIGEYFVNAISASVGTRRVKVGPLLSAPNRVSVAYTPKDASVVPPVTGTKTVSSVINNTTPQARYGIIEKLLDGGEMTAADVAQFEQTFLAEYAYPISTETIELGSSEAPSLSLECLGYIHWMNAYTYTNTTAGTVTYSARLQALLAANPNAGMFSTDYGGIGANAATIEQYTVDNKTAYSLAKETVARGDAAYNRWTFGMYADRKAVYAALPTTQEYAHEITAPEMEITRATGRAVVEPWNVLPARWVFDPDFLIGRSPVVTDIRQDPRNVFIESVSFSAPYGLSLNGSRVATFSLNQIMLAMGINGLGGA